MPKPRNLITDEIATAEKDIYQDYIGSTLLNPDKILKTESSSRSVELYEDLLRDDKVGSTLQTRKLAVVGKEWDIVPASEKRADQKVADYVKEVFLSCNYDAARQSLLSGVVIGFKPVEIMWEYSEGHVWIKEIIGRASRRFVFDTQRTMRMITLNNMVHGEELPDRKFLVFTNTSDNGSPYGDGLGRMLYWPVWFKKNAVKFWMIFADKFGSPTVVGKYPPGTAKPQQDDLLDALDAIQQESAITMPDNIAVELLEATRGGAANTYESLCKFMNGSIAQVMLGQTLTSEIAGTGTYAASKTHEEVRQDYIRADADALCEIQNNTLIRWIVDYNFPAVRAYPKVWIRTEPEEDLKPLADRDKILVVDIGVPVTKKYFYDTYGIPEPKEGEEIVEAVPHNPLSVPVKNEQPTPAPPRRGNGQRSFAELADVSDLIEAQGDIDGLADDALARGGVNLSVIERAVEEAESYEDLQTRLGEAYRDIDMDGFQEILAQALFMADLKGRMLL